MTETRLIRPEEYRVMPWKNGLGTTAEIATEPGAVVPVSCTIPPVGTLDSEKFSRAGCATATLTVIGVSVLPAPLSPVRR